MFTITQLMTFIRVAETGSFHKAAEEVFMTPTGVMKQVNTLEEEVGAALLERTHRGQILTKIGEEFYNDACKIIEMCKTASDKARTSEMKKNNTVRLGNSVMTPIEVFDDLWIEVRKKCPDINMEIVLFDNVPNEYGNYMPYPGTTFDIVPITFDGFNPLAEHMDIIEIVKSEIYAIVSINHPLACKKIIETEDLHGATIVVRNGYFESFREYISSVQTVVMKEIQAYTTDAYNDIASSNDIMLGMGNLTKVHPFLKRIPIRWEPGCWLGLGYSKNPTPATVRFIEAVKETVDEKHKA